MNNIIYRLRHIALATAAVLIGLDATAQTAIVKDREWYGNSGTTMNAFTTFDNDYLFKQGPTRTPNSTLPITIGSNTYPTYDLRDTGEDAVKFILGPGQGTVKVYYTDNRAEFTRTLRATDSNLQLHDGYDNNNNVSLPTTRTDNLVNFTGAWTGMSWAFDQSEQIKVSSFTLRLPNDNISGNIARVRIVFRFQGGGEQNDSEEWTVAGGTNQTLTLNISDAHKDDILRSIYIQNNSTGSIRVGDCTLTGTAVDNSALSRRVTTQMRPTDDNVMPYGGTTANGNTVVFTGGWTGFSWRVDDTHTKLSRFTMTLDNSSIPENERAAVRVVVRYRNSSVEDVSDPWDWQQGGTSSPNASKTYFTVTPSAAGQDLYIREIYIQNSGVGRVNISQAELVADVEVESSNTPVLRNENRVEYTGASVSNGTNGTKILTYNFNNTANRTQYYVSGGLVGAIEIDYNELTITPTDLQPITEDFFWYYNGGGGIYNKGYTNNDRVYRAINASGSTTGAIGAGGPLHQTDGTTDQWIYVNGAELSGDASHTNNHYYTLNQNNAIGFKLDRTKKYRIRVFSDVQNPLYMGATVAGATQVASNGESVRVIETRVNVNATDWSHTYLYTYEITGSGDTYWIKGSEAGVHLGGFDVCPYDNNDESLSTVASLPSSEFSWFADELDIQETNQCGNLNHPQVVHTGQSGQYVYVVGPTMAINQFVIDSGTGNRTVLLNNGNKIGIKVPAGMTLHFTVAADQNVPVNVIHNGTTEAYQLTSGGGFLNVNYDAVNTETIWITGGSDQYVFFDGFTLTPITTSDADDPDPITNDYIWYSGEQIGQSALFGGEYLANNGVAKTLMPDDQTKVDGNMIGVYDLSRSAESIRLTLANDLNVGEIRVFYEMADLATPENLDLTSYQPSYDWADFYNISSNSGQTITYAYTNNPGTETEYPARGYQLTPSTGKYDRVTVNLSSNPNAFYWHIIVLYDNGNGGDSPYSTGTTCTADIDPTRTLMGFVIQGAIGPNETKTITVGSVEFNRLGSAAGTRGETSLYCGARQADGIATLGNRFQVEGTNYISYFFNYNESSTAPSSRDYYIQGGFVAAVEVFKSNNIGWGDSVTDDETGGNPNLKAIAPTDLTYRWNVEQALGTTINNGTDQMVLNGHTMWPNNLSGSTSTGNNYVLIYGDPNSNNNKFHRDLALNSTEVNANRTVLMDWCHAVGLKLEHGGRYKVTAYWSNCDGKGSIYFCSRQKDFNGTTKNAIYPRNHATSDIIASQSDGESTFVVNLQGETLDRVVWISAVDSDPIYFSGFKVEPYLDYYIEIDDHQPGIFTGKYKFGGQQKKVNGVLQYDSDDNPIWEDDLEPDKEEKLLIYLSDNGTYESFRAPVVNGINEIIRQDNKPTKTNLTTTPSKVILVKKLELKDIATNNPSTPTIVADGKIGDQNVYKVSGFEDTDNDRLYKVIYSYTPEGQSETFTDYYYVWYANFLKIGWWTNREAKLIVDSNNSYNDPDHIIVGDFYISSGENATFYYDVINPGKDTAGNVVGYYVDNAKGVTYGYGNAVFDRAEWSYTEDNGQIQTKSRSFSPTATEKKSNGVDPEEFSWTKMNDHKNHTGDGISLGYPADASYWGDNEVVKTITFRAKRNGGWPDWTARLTFHYVVAPTISVYSTSQSHKTVQMTHAHRLTGQTTANSNIYYTTDGTNPTTNGGVPTNQTYIYDETNKPTNRHMTIYYAAELVNMPKSFYIHNPFTTHIEGETMYTLMDKASNRSNTFLAVSKEFEAPVVDPLVEYVSPSRYIISKARDNALTTTTSYDEWGTAVSGTQSISALGAGGFMYKYPFAQQRRDVMVLFGNSSKPVYRENVFKNVGVYWGIDENDNFAEHFDATLYKWKTMGYNYDAEHGGNSESENGNPHTECNGGIGGENTEGGGLWLQPITGDFLRFEPEYDGVITVWIRHNGAAQGDEYYGNITRRPVYVVDENGKVMRRSTVKPTQDDYFGIDGLYAEICTNRSTVRHDCRTDWVNGLTNWKDGYKEKKDGPVVGGLPWRNMATFRLYNFWYGFPLFQNKNVDRHVPRGVTAATDENDTSKPYRFSMDVADSWVSRSAKVKSVQCEFNSIVYHSQQLHNDIEKSDEIKFVHGDGSTDVVDGNIYSGDKFALYGWELPAFNVVRYRFPVKAGKSYYMGGRGTKNGYMGMKFEPLPANYKPSDYVTTEYRKLYEATSTVKINNVDVAVNAFKAYDHIAQDGIHAHDAYDVETTSGRAAALATYTTSTDMRTTTVGNFTDAKRPNIPTYDIWETPMGNDFNFWYGSSTAGGSTGHANVLYQDTATVYWNNGQSPIINENSHVGHTCNVRLHRQFTKGYWHPIVLPFSISESRMKEIFGDEVQVLYLDPYNNTKKTNQNTNYTYDKDGVAMGANGASGKWVSALDPAVCYANLRFTYHHYQMLYANVPAFVCPGGKRKVNGAWTADWTTFGSKYVDRDPDTGEAVTGHYEGDPILIERVTVDRSNLGITERDDKTTYKDYNKIGYKIGETDDWEYWVTGTYTPGMQGATDGVYYMTNELTDQGGEQKMRAVIYHSPNGKTLKATRCWIAARKKSTSNVPYGHAPLLTTVSFGGFDGQGIDPYDTPSGIEDIIMDEDRVILNEALAGDDSVYDVMGRKVGYGTTDGLPSGVYIMRGKKVYVK